MRLEVTVRAVRDLREMHAYGMQAYGPVRADAYLAEMLAKFDVVAEWPAAWRERRNVQPPVRLTRQRAHNILYAIVNETVVVLRVLHNSVNWVDLL